VCTTGKNIELSRHTTSVVFASGSRLKLLYITSRQYQSCRAADFARRNFAPKTVIAATPSPPR